MKKTLLILLSINMALFSDLSRDSIGIVTDNNTTLQWQDNYIDNGGDIKITNWENAIKYCDKLSLDGEKWRLPNKNELLSIVDQTHNNPSIDTTIFENTISDLYWTSTTNKSVTSYAWYIRFSDGYLSRGGYKANKGYVRCVRSKQ